MNRSRSAKSAGLSVLSSKSSSLTHSKPLSRSYSAPLNDVFQEDETNAKPWEPHTLAHFLLASNSVPPVSPHSGAEIIRRLLGHDSFSLRFASIQKESLGICESLFIHLLTVDIDSNPALRACVAYSAARAFGCMYTSSQMASLGTLSSGAAQFLPIIRLSYDEELRREIFTEPAVALLRFAASITTAPSRATESCRVALALHYTVAEEEAMVLACAFVSYFSRFNSTIGTPLEYLALLNSEQFLKPENQLELKYLQRWTPGVHISPLDATRLHDEATNAASTAEESRPVSLARLAQFHLVDHARLIGIPRTITMLKVLLRKELGFVPYYLIRFSDVNARRSMSYAVLKGLGRANSHYLPVGTKFAMCFLQAYLAKNDILKAHFAFLAFHNGIPLCYLAALLEKDDDPEKYSPEEILAFRMAAATQPMPGNVNRKLSKLVVDRVKPELVIEMTTALAVGSMLQTITSAYPPTGYEGEIRFFVRYAAQEGFSLLRSHTGYFADWDSQSRSFRSSRVHVKSRARGIFVV